MENPETFQNGKWLEENFVSKNENNLFQVLFISRFTFTFQGFSGLSLLLLGLLCLWRSSWAKPMDSPDNQPEPAVAGSSRTGRVARQGDLEAQGTIGGLGIYGGGLGGYGAGIGGLGGYGAGLGGLGGYGGGLGGYGGGLGLGGIGAGYGYGGYNSLGVGGLYGGRPSVPSIFHSFHYPPFKSSCII